MSAAIQLIQLVTFLIGQGKAAADAVIAMAKARGYQGDTDALLAVAVEADALRAAAEARR